MGFQIALQIQPYAGGPHKAAGGGSEQHATEQEAASKTSPKQVQGIEFNGVICTRLEQGVLPPLHCLTTTVSLFENLFIRGKV